MRIIAVGLNFSESLRAGTTIRAAVDNAKAALDLSEEQFSVVRHVEVGHAKFHTNHLTMLSI